MVALPYLASVGSVSLAGGTVLTFMARTPRTRAQMVERLDEALIERVVWMVDGPERANVMTFEIMEALGGRREMLHVLQQARLMTGIVAELKKDGVSGGLLDAMKRKRRALWRSVAGYLFLPRVFAYTVAKTFSEMAAMLEDAVVFVDSGMATQVL